VAIADQADLRVLGGYSGSDIPDPELLKACVHCGMCLSSCPTYRMTGQEMSSPRGRLWMMSAVGEGRMDLLDPSAALRLDAELLAQFPEGYRHLAYLQSRVGFKIKRDMPRLKGPVVQALYARGAQWLAGAASAFDEPPVESGL